MSHTITLHTAIEAETIFAKARTWVIGKVKAGRPVKLTLEEPRRTIPQNSHIHPLVKEIAVALGRPTDQESLRKLRYLLLEQWRHETGQTPLFERSLDGLRWVSIDKGTSDLDKPDCSSFIEWLGAQA